MVVSPFGHTRKLHNMTRVSCTDYGDDQKHHELILHLCQAQDQEPPWHFLQNCTHWMANCMDSLKVRLDSGTPGEGPITYTPHPHHVVLCNKQPMGTGHFWHLYMVNALVLRTNSLHQLIFLALHTVQTSRKRGQYRSQWHWGDNQYQGDRHRLTWPVRKNK